jgi:SPP1 gp7 family putative phage head morphogenesis protein
MKPPTPEYLAARRFVFARGVARHFNQDAEQLLKALDALKGAVNSASSLEGLPPFTDIAIQYGALLARGILMAFVKGSDAGRKRKYRKNSLSLEDVVDFSWNLQNTAAVAAFSRQAFEMAGIQTEELKQALFDEAKAVFASGGTYRDWADTFSLHGFAPENPYQLRTNYDTAANAAYAAGQWEQIQEMKMSFPYLRYVTMRDDKVRDEHAALDGLVFPVDDPFWDMYMPPNDWNCRCSVEQLLEEEFDPETQPQLAEIPLAIPPSFQNNPGKSHALYTNTLNAVITNWKDAGLPKWVQYSSAEAKLIDTDHMDQNQLLSMYAGILGDRHVLDVNSMPVYLDSKKAGKFAGYSLADLKGRFKYLNCIEDAIKKPHEAWLNPTTNRIYYLKKYDKNVVLIAEINQDNQIEYFNIMIGSDNLANTNRQGVLLHQ